MSAGAVCASYARLDQSSRRLLQLCAIFDSSIRRQDIATLYIESGCTGGNGKRLSKTDVDKTIVKLLKQKFLVTGSYGSVRVDPDLQDMAVQDSIRDDSFQKLNDVVAKKRPRSYFHGDESTRNLRMAFYQGNVDEYRAHLRGKSRDSNVKLLNPFSRDIFDNLDPILRELYLADVVPRIIVNADGSRELLAAFDELIDAQSSHEDDFLAAWLDLAVARGDLESLARLDDLTGSKLNEVAGCTALLQGDLEQAEVCLGAVMPSGKRKSRLSPIGHLPALLNLLLLFEQGSAESMAEARSIVSSATKARKACYTGAIAIAGAAIAFKQSPSSPAAFAINLQELCSTPLETLLAGYFANWLLTGDDTSFQISNLVQTATAYRKSGLQWFSAEASGLAGKSKLKTAAAQTSKHTETHARLGTSSLVDLVEPEPFWQRSLNAIAQLGTVIPCTVESTVETERVIWELNTRYNGIQLEVFQQKRKGKEWTKGRKIALQRLYEQFADPAFSFLTEQDRALCRALESSTERNHYGYWETHCYFDDLRAARAIVGHPRIYPAGDRENPIEVVEQPPKLVVSEEKDGQISLILDPKPKHDEAFRKIVDGRHRVAITFFDDQHLQLHQILGGELKVPAAAATQVVKAIEQVASLVTVHSEIGHAEIGANQFDDASAAGGETVQADAQPHVHLLPYQGGLRAEFFVRPFGDDWSFLPRRSRWRERLCQHRWQTDDGPARSGRRASAAR